MSGSSLSSSFLGPGADSTTSDERNALFVHLWPGCHGSPHLVQGVPRPVGREEDEGAKDEEPGDEDEPAAEEEVRKGLCILALEPEEP